MSALGKKLVVNEYNDGQIDHFCPACNRRHSFAVGAPFANGARWTFDGDLVSPTFNPSMNISWGPFPDGRIERCHYFLHAGYIKYLPDCTHALKGMSVELPDIPVAK